MPCIKFEKFPLGFLKPSSVLYESPKITHFRLRADVNAVIDYRDRRLCQAFRLLPLHGGTQSARCRGRVVWECSKYKGF